MSGRDIGRWGHLLALGPFLIGLLATAALPAFAETSATRGLSIDLSDLDPPAAEVGVMPLGWDVVSGIKFVNGSATFAANVTVTKPPAGIAQVELNAESNQGWVTSVTPPSLVFSGDGGRQAVSIAVGVPGRTDGGTQGALSVRATVVYLRQSMSDESSAVLRVRTHSAVIVTRAAMVADRGFLSAQLTLVNLGNHGDSFTLRSLAIENGSMVMPRARDAVFLAPSFSSWGTANCSLSIPLAPGTPGGKVTARFFLDHSAPGNLSNLFLIGQWPLEWTVPQPTFGESAARAVGPLATFEPLIAVLIGTLLGAILLRRRRRMAGR